MSSIDKYVRDEARSRDSRVIVRNENGRLCGYINGEKIFDIRDRIGYLSEEERKTIVDSVDEYRRMEAQLEQERRRLAEEARKRAVDRAESLYVQKEQDIRRSVELSRASVENARRSLSAAAGNFTRLKSDVLNLNAVSSVIAQANRALDGANAAAERAEETALSELSKLRVGSGVSVDEANRLASSISKINCRPAAASGIASAKEAEDRLRQLFPMLTEINNLAEQLRQADAQTAEEKLVVKDALACIGRADVTSVSALTELKSALSDYFARLRELAENAATERERAAIHELEAVLSSFGERLETYVGQSSYSVHSYLPEITAASEEISSLLERISQYEYTGVSSAAVSSLSKIAEEVVLGGMGDEVSHKKIDACLKRCREIVAHAEAVKNLYAEYKARVERIRNYGTLEEDIPRFSEENTAGLFKELEQLEIAEKERCEESTILEKRLQTERIMTECGFKVLRREKEGAAYAEDIFVREGYPNVIYQALILPNGAVRLSLTGVSRTDGRQTTIEHIVDSARQLREGGVTEAIAIKFEEIGGTISAALDDDGDPAAIEQSINNTGYLYLDEESEKLFDAATALPAYDQTQKARKGKDQRSLQDMLETVPEGRRRSDLAALKRQLSNMHRAAR